MVNLTVLDSALNYTWLAECLCMDRQQKHRGCAQHWARAKGCPRTAQLVDLLLLVELCTAPPAPRV